VVNLKAERSSLFAEDHLLVLLYLPALQDGVQVHLLLLLRVLFLELG
jgi:hypothetical protein